MNTRLARVLRGRRYSVNHDACILALLMTEQETAADHSIAAHIKATIRTLEASLVAFKDDRTDRAAALIADALKKSKPLLVCGNGGSAADAEHITGELVGRFLKDRKALNAICLSSNAAVLTAWSNDRAFEEVFARQIEAHGGSGGVLLAISTSGTSKNIVRAAETAKRMKIPVISLTGQGGGLLRPLSDILLDVPSTSTPLIQQMHICLYHYICQRVEALVG
jgi:D-sedoheptulose 7-phosphate isomerase